MKEENSFNDRMVKKTVVPLIYLWMLAAALVVGIGVAEPFMRGTTIILTNLDGFIALIAIIGGVAVPALTTLLRMWENEQSGEINEHPIQSEHERQRDIAEHEHHMKMEEELKYHWTDAHREPVKVAVKRPIEKRE